jgi:hypothetical protein
MYDERGGILLASPCPRFAYAVQVKTDRASHGAPAQSEVVPHRSGWADTDKQVLTTWGTQS